MGQHDVISFVEVEELPLAGRHRKLELDAPRQWRLTLLTGDGASVHYQESIAPADALWTTLLDKAWDLYHDAEQVTDVMDKIGVLVLEQRGEHGDNYTEVLGLVDLEAEGL
jgi:hypothetical protein